MLLLGLEWVGSAAGRATVNGLSTAALYGVIAVALVLSFRMSRTVAFVHGGIALIGAFLFWYMTYGAESAYYPKGGVGGEGTGAQTWNRGGSLVAIIILGAILGAVYGTIVMGRMRTWPRVTVTTFSLGIMLLTAGVINEIWPGLTEEFPSPFGENRYTFFKQTIRQGEIAGIVLLVVLVVVLTLVLGRTRTGNYVRAIADDSEAAQLVGIPIEKIGVGVWAVSGSISALSGVLIAAQINLSLVTLLLVMLRAFTVGMLGGFNSLPLVLVGALAFGEIEGLIGGGAFGNVSGGTREVVLIVLLLGAVYVVNKFSGKQSELLEA